MVDGKTETRPPYGWPVPFKLRRTLERGFPTDISYADTSEWWRKHIKSCEPTTSTSGGEEKDVQEAVHSIRSCRKPKSRGCEKRIATERRKYTQYTQWKRQEEP